MRVEKAEVGRVLGYRGNGAVGKQRTCLRVRLASDPGLVKRLNALKEKLSDA